MIHPGYPVQFSVDYPDHPLDRWEPAQRKAPNLGARHLVDPHRAVLPDDLVRALLGAAQELRVRARVSDVD